VHEGYYQYRRDMTLHARKVFFNKQAGYWVVLDWLESSGEHDYQAYFHGVAPGRMVGTTILLGDSPQLAVIPPAEDAVTLTQVDDPGLTAYITEKGLHADSYPCFRYETHAGSTCLAWVLCPDGRPTVRRLPVSVNGIDEDAHGATALEIAFPDYTDTLVVSHKDFDGWLACAGIDTWGFLAYRRVNAAGNLLSSIEHTMADGVCGR
jgi:hypothetical protein